MNVWSLRAAETRVVAVLFVAFVHAQEVGRRCARLRPLPRRIIGDHRRVRCKLYCEGCIESEIQTSTSEVLHQDHVQYAKQICIGHIVNLLTVHRRKEIWRGSETWFEPSWNMPHRQASNHTHAQHQICGWDNMMTCHWVGETNLGAYPRLKPWEE